MSDGEGVNKVSRVSYEYLQTMNITSMPRFMMAMLAMLVVHTAYNDKQTFDHAALEIQKERERERVQLSEVFQ
jgi:hypothetical protein